jgi:hypothetical protein
VEKAQRGARPRSHPVDQKIERNVAAIGGHQNHCDHHQPDHGEDKRFAGADEHLAEGIAADSVCDVENNHAEQHEPEQRARHGPRNMQDACCEHRRI